MSKKVSYQPKFLFALPKNLAQRKNTTYIHNSAWNFNHTMKERDIKADKILNKEIDKTIDYIEDLIVAYRREEAKLIVQLNLEAKQGDKKITRRDFKVIVNDLIKNDPGIKALFKYKHEMHGMGGAANVAKKNKTATSTGVANNKILGAAEELNQVLLKLAENKQMYSSPDRYLEDVLEKFKKLDVFRGKGMDLNNSKESEIFFKHLLGIGQPLGHVAEKQLYKMFFGNDYKMVEGHPTQGFDLFITEKEFGIEVKSNINSYLTKNIVGTRSIDDLLDGASQSEQGQALYVIGNMLASGLKIRTRATGPTFVAYQLRLALHIMELVRALEGGKFSAKSLSKDVKGVMIVTPKEMVYASDLFQSLLKVLRSGNARDLTKNIVGTASFFKTEMTDNVKAPVRTGRNGMRAMKNTARKGLTGNKEIYEAMDTAMRSDFARVNREVRQTRFKLKYHLNMV